MIPFFKINIHFHTRKSEMTIADINATGHVHGLVPIRTLQDAILNNVHFSYIATNASGIIQIFSAGAEKILGYATNDVLNKITAADLCDPQYLAKRSQTLSTEGGVTVVPGFEALVLNADFSSVDQYEMNFMRKDKSCLATFVSVMALCDIQEAIIGYIFIIKDNTEKKFIDKKLHDLQFYTRSLIESSIDALATTDPMGIITDVNSQMEKLVACSRQDLIGSPFGKYFTDPVMADTGIKKVLIDKKVIDYEMTAISINGNKTAVSCNATTFYDQNQKLQGVFVQARDITERNKVDDKIRKVNRLLTCIGKSQAAFIIEKTSMSMFNNVLTELLEASESEIGFISEVLYDEKNIPYLKTFSISNIAWDKKSEEMFDIASKTGLEFHNLHTLFGAVVTSNKYVISNNPQSDPRKGGLPNGHRRIDNLLGIPFYKLNKIIGIYMVANRTGGYDEAMVNYLQPFTDTLANLVEAVNENRRQAITEKKLKESEHRFRGLVETAPTIVLLLNPNWTIDYVNPYLEKLTGYQRNEILGKDWLATFIPEHDREHIKVLLETSLASKSLLDIVHPIRTRDGRELQIEWYDCELRDEAGNVNGLLKIGQDVTERLQFQRQLEKSLSEKEMMMREIHHRVKNNLQMISAMLELQANAMTDKNALNYFKDNQQRILSMALIHEQLYQNGNFGTINFPFYLRDLVANLRSQFNDLCPNLKIEINTMPCLLPVDVAIPIGLAFNELTSNVFKHAFNSEMDGELHIDLKYSDDGVLMLAIKDNGKGFPEGLDIYNNKYFGLRLVRLLVEKQLHGKLTFESNHGTSVVCQLRVEE
jgi:PAS domain S-box-containing protein